MKRAFSVLVCAAMIFSLTACGEASVSDEKDAAEGDAAASGKLAVITPEKEVKPGSEVK